MPNIKSAKKRVKVTKVRSARNKAKNTALKTAIKKVNKAVEAKDKETAVKAFNECNSLLDKAATSHLKTKNYVSREKARLAKAVATLG